MVLLRGIELELHENEDFSNAIRRDGDFYESDILDYLRYNFPVHDLIVDAGANIGNHTLYFANFLHYNGIMAFEPWGENYNILVKNINRFRDSKQGVDKRVVSFPFGLSDKVGAASFSVNKSNMGASEINSGGTDSINVIPLDAALLFITGEVTLLKIDVEWHEPQVIEGAKETILKDHPLILIEDSSLRYYEILEPLGYELHKSWLHHNTYLYRWKND